MIAPRIDHFLSEEDLDLQNMTWNELVAWWNLWLEQAQITNEIDRDEYSHGVFRYGPLVIETRELDEPIGKDAK